MARIGSKRALMEAQAPLAGGVAKPDRTAQRTPILAVDAVGKQDRVVGAAHRDQVDRSPLAERQVTGRDCLRNRCRRLDPAGGSELYEVQVQERTYAT